MISTSLHFPFITYSHQTSLIFRAPFPNNKLSLSYNPFYDIVGLTAMEAMATIMVMVMMLFSSVSGTNVTVGGSTGWDLTTNLTHWSYSTPIFVNDSLLFVYTPAHDVIEVNEPDFASCDMRSPVGAYNDVSGETVIILPQPGPRYFVCGRSNHCSLGLKVRVQVLDSPNVQPNTSSPNLPYNHTTSDGNNTPQSSDGHGKAIIWDQLVITIICLCVAIFGTDFITLFWYAVHPSICLFSGIMVMSIISGFAEMII